MKRILLLLVMGINAVSFGQQAVIFEEGGKYGLKTDFGKELLAAEYEKITKCSTDTLDFYICDFVGVAELYSYSSQKRDIYNEVGQKQFSVIKWEFNEAKQVNVFCGYTQLGEKFILNGQKWEPVKVKGMIGCKDKTGKYGVCLDGKALSNYMYLDIDARHRDLAVAKTDSGWIALDSKMKSHYNWSFDKIYDSDIHPEAFVVKKGAQYGILSLDDALVLPPYVIKNPKGMFELEDGIAYGELVRSYAVQKGEKWGIVNEKNAVQVDFRYDNAYMIDDFAVEQHGLSVHAVVKDGGTWKFLNEKWKEHKSVQFDQWLGTHGEVALIIKNGKVWQIDLKSFEEAANLYFGDYQEREIIKGEDGVSGVVGKKGDILMPFEFEWIALEGDEGDEFFVAQKGGKDGVYNLDGKMLVPHNYEDLVFLEKKNGKSYFSVGKAGEAALAYWDTDSNKMILLTKKMYLNVSYHFGDKKFTAETSDKVYHVLDDEGNLIQE